jgi:hypothetical protein
VITRNSVLLLLLFALFSFNSDVYKTYNKPHIMLSGTFLGWKGLLAFAVGGESEISPPSLLSVGVGSEVGCLIRFIKLVHYWYN